MIVIRTYIFRLYNQICVLYGMLRKALELRISKCTSESILYFNIVIINKFHISYSDMFVCYIGMERNSTVSDEIKKNADVDILEFLQILHFWAYIFIQWLNRFQWKFSSKLKETILSSDKIIFMSISYEFVEIWHPTLFCHSMRNIHCIKDYLMKKFYGCKQPLYAISNIFQFRWRTLSSIKLMNKSSDTTT